MADHGKDLLHRRCPRLGGPVAFSYCRDNGEDGLPCWKAFECWWEIFDVTSYLKEYLTEEKFSALVQKKPKPKILSLVELIEKAKQNIQSGNSKQDISEES